jgi:hypothetical protein
MNADIDQPVRKQTYTLRGKKSYVSAGEYFSANTSILAGVASSIADLSSLRKQSYKPLEALRSPNDIDRYAAIKALVHQQIPKNRVLFAFEKLLAHEVDDRVALEAAASAAALGSEVGQQRVLQFIWENDNRADLRMEAVFLLTELGQNPFAREQLNRIARSPSFQGDEVRQAAVWGLGKAGLKYYQDVFPFIDDPDENVALHAMGAFGSDTPRVIIDRLVQDLVGNDLRRAPAASETLRIIGTIDVIEALIATAQATHAVPDWILATLGRLPSEQLRRLLHGHPLLERISPMLLLSEGSNWLASINRTIDIGFLMKQNVF